MKKRYLIIAMAILVLVISSVSLTGCAKLKNDEAFDILREAYENSIGIKEGSEWGKIYYYQETIREKAHFDNGTAVEGYQKDLSVNVHCYYDEKKGMISTKIIVFQSIKNTKKKPLTQLKKLQCLTLEQMN